MLNRMLKVLNYKVISINKKIIFCCILYNYDHKRKEKDKWTFNNLNKILIKILIYLKLY